VSGGRLWGGRFGEEPAEAFDRLNDSLPLDGRLWRQDLAGSRAHARMLGATGILPVSIARKMCANRLQGCQCSLRCRCRTRSRLRGVRLRIRFRILKRCLIGGVELLLQSINLYIGRGDCLLQATLARC